MRDMDLPFAKQTPTEMNLSAAAVAGGLVIMAAAVPVPEHGTYPALVYRFAKPDGSGFYPPIVLVVDEDQMLKTAQLTASAVAAAVEAASK
ncbi:MAG: hypothetical protein HOQ21_10040 [Dermatophilaceae bacterium]|nr:hypothetical protein [Dermatophilaceae bacterium]